MSDQQHYYVDIPGVTDHPALANTQDDTDRINRMNGVSPADTTRVKTDSTRDQLGGTGIVSNGETYEDYYNRQQARGNYLSSARQTLKAQDQKRLTTTAADATYVAPKNRK